MTRKITIFGILFLLVIGQVACGPRGEEKLVLNAFENYKTAILNNEGGDAIKFIDSRTIKYYSDMLELVKTADSKQIETLSILDKMMVLIIRHRCSKEEILNFNGKSLVIYAIESGMIGKNSVTNLSIGSIVVDKNFAKGQVVSSGQKMPLYMHFYKEDNQWKIDLTSLFLISNLALKKMADESGMNQNEYIFSLLEIISGKKPSGEILKPIMEK